MKFVISTQYIENYGAHSEDGKFSSGNAYWKMKGGSDYIVSGLTRIQDAVAFVMAKFGENDLYGKASPQRTARLNSGRTSWKRWTASMPSSS